ncbi:MAG: HlyD family efflux transporter periplasmic adaptor subunit [Acidocella sp.]|nr:HlyD family efflux transporter periplasmic adaptor subunit [Acidocella sp.]
MRGLVALGVSLVLSQANAALAAASARDWVAATAATVTPVISAYADVQTSRLVGIAPAVPGVLAGLDVMPGDVVTAGQVLAEISGPQVAASLVQAQAGLHAAAASDHAAVMALAAEQQKYRVRLSTRQNVVQAQSALVAAESVMATAKARLAAVRQAMVLRSPAAGIVQDVTAANGDVLAVGAMVARVQPQNGAWVRAVFYGDMAETGARGVFTPEGGGAPVAVTWRGALGSARADGGVPVALSASVPLTPGAHGMVTINLPAQTATMVPSAALILDKGKWWVMRHDAKGDHAVAVIPGDAQGYDTIIKSGLAPGDDVVVVDAYLLYNRGIAALYQPPD